MTACAEEAYDRALAVIEKRELIAACQTVEADEFHVEMERSEEGA